MAFAALSVLVALPAGVRAQQSAPGTRPASLVTLVRTPYGGIQPQAAVDGSGILHVVYFTGAPAHGDLFYVRRPLSTAGDGAWSRPVRVNDRPGTAIAVGTIRGAQIAVGRRGRVHVAWNGSDRAPTGPGGAPMLYVRLNDAGTAFEPERNLITWAGNIDGGGAVAADPNGRVYVLWHATPLGKDEAAGGIYLARSEDDGRTFGKEERIAMPPLGACACCGMKAAVAPNSGAVHVLYRAAEGNTERDTVLLTSRDHGRSFRTLRLEPWPVNTCPMSAFSLTPSPRGGMIGAWETKGQVSFGPVATFAERGMLPAGGATPAPGHGADRKYPVAVSDAAGSTLFAWVEGAGWQRGGSLAYRVYRPDGSAAGGTRRVNMGVPVWSLVAATARPGGGFLLLY
jgi:hypothetical protein